MCDNDFIGNCSQRELKTKSTVQTMLKYIPFVETIIVTSIIIHD